MRGSACIFAAVLVVAAFGLSGARATASGTSLHLCNKSEYQINIAIGYASSGPDDTGDVLTGPFVSRGWWILGPSECITLSNPFSARYMYWTGYRDGAFLWDSGDSHFCVPSTISRPPRFTFERQNESEDACVNSTPLSSNGPNQWLPTREVDVSVDPDVDFDGN